MQIPSKPTNPERTSHAAANLAIAPRAGSGRGSTFGRWLKRAMLTLLVLVAIASLSVVLVVKHFEAGLPSIPDLQGNYHPPQVTRVLARDGTLLAELYTERRTVVPIETLIS